MKAIGSKIKEDETYLKRADYQKELLRKLEAEKEKVKLGGGQIAIEKQKAKGKIPARERINLLVDNSKEFFELSTFAAYGMYKEFGGAASVATITNSAPRSGKAS